MEFMLDPQALDAPAHSGDGYGGSGVSLLLCAVDC